MTDRTKQKMKTAGRWLSLIAGSLTVVTFAVRGLTAVFQLSSSVQQLAEAVAEFKPAIESLNGKVGSLQERQARTEVVDADQQATLADHAGRIQYLERRAHSQ